MRRYCERGVVADPLAGFTWSRPEIVARFVNSPPNVTLVRFAEQELRRLARRRALDIGCGAGRNAIPLAAQGWNVVGLDLSLPMITAAAEGIRRRRLSGHVAWTLSPMDALPLRDHSCDLLVAHGIWNLALSAATFRRAVREAARVARHGAALFVFTFSRNTLPSNASPVPGESFVFTQFSGEPQCFLTDEELVCELAAAGFVLDSDVPLRELNRRPAGPFGTGAPIIYEGVFRREKRYR